MFDSLFKDLFLESFCFDNQLIKHELMINRIFIKFSTAGHAKQAGTRD